MSDNSSEIDDLVSVSVAAEQTGYAPTTIVTLAMTHQIEARKERISAPNKLGLRYRVQWQINLPSLKAYITHRKEIRTVVKRQDLGVVWLICPVWAGDAAVSRNMGLL